jgi:hypothetical protein
VTASEGQPRRGREHGVAERPHELQDAGLAGNALRPTNPVAPRIKTFLPNTTLSCELSQVVVHMNLQELAPLYWRHLAEHRMWLPGIGVCRVPGSL